MKFRKGDIVQFINETERVDGGVSRAFTGHLTVLEYNRDESLITFKNKAGDKTSCLPRRLKLISRLYQVGDKVRVVKESGNEGLLDAVGVVIQDDGSSMPYKLRFEGWKDGHGEGHNEWWVTADDIEPAGDVKPYKPDPVEPPKFKAGDWVKASTHRKSFSLAIYERGLKYGTFVRYCPGLSSDTIVMRDLRGVECTMWLDTCEHVKASEIAAMPKGGLYGLSADRIITDDFISPTVTVAKQMYNRYESVKHIVVQMLANGSLRPSSSPFVHLNRTDAEREALRLAETVKVSPGTTFVVMSMVSKAVPPVPTSATLVNV